MAPYGSTWSCHPSDTHYAVRWEAAHVAHAEFRTDQLAVLEVQVAGTDRSAGQSFAVSMWLPCLAGFAEVALTSECPTSTADHDATRRSRAAAKMS